MFDTLRNILVDKLKVSPDLITAEATPEEIDLDSLAIVELSLVLQKELGIEISDDELTEAETVGDIVRLMDERSARV
ncbi:acyl carrier protein [Streptomyces alkaliterrae]|uniref:Acyl carrier protein n=1 Tax=Streptomyces alkaliterrae TaxID=2213162 RepID=A0A5P0YPJ5_9ACTN|nr:phosphopantetheine-binding protein [Streptomyces alkaliterrae]MBB1253524.1 acyl carrier protein [Streptomyces alkaliterrae]MBB1258464.1 acyl carrier protein [Streptomyces alkaliterrae]MQS01830.1 acyl carrier protein [Streptomyces alkaliterrae]